MVPVSFTAALSATGPETSMFFDQIVHFDCTLRPARGHPAPPASRSVHLSATSQISPRARPQFAARQLILFWSGSALQEWATHFLVVPLWYCQKYHALSVAPLSPLPAPSGSASPPATSMPQVLTPPQWPPSINRAHVTASTRLGSSLSGKHSGQKKMRTYMDIQGRKFPLTTLFRRYYLASHPGESLVFECSLHWL